MPLSHQSESAQSGVKIQSTKSISTFTQDEEFVQFLKQIELFTTTEETPQANSS
jgi:hypothetical protein